METLLQHVSTMVLSGNWGVGLSRGHSPSLSALEVPGWTVPSQSPFCQNTQEQLGSGGAVLTWLTLIVFLQWPLSIWFWDD